MTTLAEKLKMKKEDRGIISRSIDMTVNKFAAIENLEKMVSGQNILVDTILEKIDNLNSDSLNFYKKTVAMEKVGIENNALLISIMTKLSEISSIQEVRVQEKNRPKTPLQKKHINIEANPAAGDI